MDNAGQNIGRINDDATGDDVVDYTDFSFDHENCIDEPHQFDQIKRNDPSLTNVVIRFGSGSHAQDIDWEKESEWIATNTHLKALGVGVWKNDNMWDDWDDSESIKKMREFCGCLAGNTCTR